ncbi:hypothetical protein D3093_35105 (plasmid) [Azospirillum argentinense]|uniref:Uncharacterized protein n=1 Tax=Azospirillum argentinense TaxID=2970906 RepID=A0A4D8PRP2_9PROT|nr:hypothetical protein [Azospirillum argentinense]QCO00477.1 hypothetical protein D3093_35105 [Azospirillum argentinense]
MATTSHHHHATVFENRINGSVVASAQVMISFSYAALPSPAGPASGGTVTFLGADIVCGPGTSIRKTRPAPPHIEMWAKRYTAANAAILIAEATADHAPQQCGTGPQKLPGASPHTRPSPPLLQHGA